MGTLPRRSAGSLRKKPKGDARIHPDVPPPLLTPHPGRAIQVARPAQGSRISSMPGQHILTFTFAVLPLAAVTVMVTSPFFRPFTTPFALTVAIVGSELVHV